MNAFRTLSGTLLVAAWACVVLGERATAQQSSDSPRWEGTSTRTQWEQKVLTRTPTEPQATRATGSAASSGATLAPAALGPRVARLWSPTRPRMAPRVAQYVPPDAEVIPVPEDQGPIAPDAGPLFGPSASAPLSELLPYDVGLDGLGGGGPRHGGHGAGAACDGCDECDEWDDGYDECPRFGRYRHDCLLALLRNATLFAGVQGFKGPMDFGVNGNFGFHEGVNFGGPLGDPWDCGFQVGFQAVQSNFFGSPTVANDGNGRDQLFFTAGIFRRAICAGLQGGVVFDYMRDNYFSQADLKQIRSETSLLFDNWHEVGYWGAYGVSKDRLDLGGQSLEFLQPNDIFALFYRRHFTGGGQGRIWGGLTGMGEGVIGADATIPLGTSWALENNVIFVIPDAGPATGAQEQESWSVSIQLVWYPGRSSRCVFQNPHHPLFWVADNSSFLVRRGGPAEPAP